MSYREVEILSSAARTATGNGDAFTGFADAESIAATLIISAASGTNPTLDVVVQHSIDGSNWFDLLTFAQKTTTGSELKVASEIQGTTVTGIGDRLRAKYTLGGTTPSFTFKVNVAAQSVD